MAAIAISAVCASQSTCQEANYPLATAGCTECAWTQQGWASVCTPALEAGSSRTVALVCATETLSSWRPLLCMQQEAKALDNKATERGSATPTQRPLPCPWHLPSFGHPCCRWPILARARGFDGWPPARITSNFTLNITHSLEQIGLVHCSL